MKNSQKDEILLIKKAQEGNMQAFEELVYRYDRKVMNIAYHYRNSADDAKDIYQEVFIRVFRGIKSFKFKSEFSTWVYRITANVCLTHKEKINRVSIDSLDKNVFDDENGISFGETLPGNSKTDDLMESNEIAEKIDLALERLPNQQRMAFTLKYYDGYKIREIAEMMGCSDGAVKRYLFIASGKLRENLKHLVSEN